MASPLSALHMKALDSCKIQGMKRGFAAQLKKKSSTMKFHRNIVSNKIASIWIT